MQGSSLFSEAVATILIDLYEYIICLTPCFIAFGFPRHLIQSSGLILSSSKPLKWLHYGSVRYYATSWLQRQAASLVRNFGPNQNCRNVTSEANSEALDITMDQFVVDQAELD